jgi:hypothetical protein
VLLDVLQRAGLTPEAKRTREGVQVKVPDDEADQAHQILVANMDVIAQAARNSPDRGARRKPRPSRRAAEGERTKDQGSTPLTSERLLRGGRPIGLIIVGILLVLVIPLPIVIRFWLVVGTVLAVIYVLGKQSQRDGEDP